MQPPLQVDLKKSITITPKISWSSLIIEVLEEDQKYRQICFQGKEISNILEKVGVTYSCRTNDNLPLFSDLMLVLTSKIQVQNIYGISLFIASQFKSIMGQ